MKHSKREHSVITKKMNNGIYEGVKVSEVPVDYLEYIIRISKEDSKNPNTLIAKDFLSNHSNADVIHRAIDYKTRLIMKEYEFFMKCINKCVLYLGKEVRMQPYTKGGKINKKVVDTLRGYAKPIVNDTVGIYKNIHGVDIDFFERFMKYELKTRDLTLNQVVSQTWINKINMEPEYYMIKPLTYDDVYAKLSSESYSVTMLLFYMSYKTQIENNTSFLD